MSHLRRSDSRRSCRRAPTPAKKLLPFDCIGSPLFDVQMPPSSATSLQSSAQPLQIPQSSVHQPSIVVAPPSGVEKCIQAQCQIFLNHPPINVAIIGHSYVRDLQSVGINFNQKLYPVNPCIIKFLSRPGSTFNDWNSDPNMISELRDLFPNSIINCIIIILGGNDFTENNLSVQPGQNPLYNIYDHIVQLYSKLKNNFPETKLINVPIENRFYRDQTIHRLSPPIDQYRVYAKRVNKFIKSKKMVNAIVCVWSEKGGINNPDLFRPDGVHLNSRGLTILSKRICLAIRNLLFPSELKYL